MFFKSNQSSKIFSLLILSLFLGLSSCSKKDVVSDEAAMAPSDEAGGVASPGAGVESMGSAGDAGYAMSEMEVVYYGYDSFNLSDEARNALKKNVTWMKENATARIQIEGHCDERGTVEYNMALGDRRANAAKAYLVRLGVASSRIEIISYGKERPADMGHNESAWAKNRRAIFVLLSK
jgi:peptidoglycan-associated lipoprotein